MPRRRFSFVIAVLTTATLVWSCQRDDLHVFDPEAAPNGSGGPCEAADLTVTAGGPNSGGSFLGGTFSPFVARENLISLSAVASGGCAGLTVMWEVIDNPDDAVASPAVIPPAAGNTSVAEVPEPQRAWPGAPPHQPNLDMTTLSYRVRAHVDGASGTVFSDPVVVSQTPRDVIRQEYIEVRSTSGGAARLPGGNEINEQLPDFASSYGPWPIYGDYCPESGPLCWFIAQPRLVDFMKWVEDAASSFLGRLQINSVYRNPVHHHRHLGLASNDSPHKYGTAVDLQTFALLICFYDSWLNIRCDTDRLLYWTALRNQGLVYPNARVCAEPFRLSGVGHVHFDLRDPEQPDCVGDWRERTPYEAGVVGAPHGYASPATALERLQAGDWEERAGAVALLTSIEPGRRPAGWVREAIALLEREIDASWHDVGATAGSDDAYGEYLIQLVGLVESTRDPAAVAPLTLMGIDVSLAVRSFVSSHPDLAIPALEAAWDRRPPLRADVVATLGQMLAAHSSGETAISPDQFTRIDRVMLAAATEPTPIGRWGLAFTAGEFGLIEWIPALEYISRNSAAVDGSGTVARTAELYLEKLTRERIALGPVEVIARTGRLLRSLCSDAAPAHASFCKSLDQQLEAAIQR